MAHGHTETDPIEVLRNEHRVIERTLDAFDDFRVQVQRGKGTPDRLAKFVDFYRGFADECHHGKEERILFEAMFEAGFSKEHGPLAVILAEHSAMRKCIRDLQAYLDRGSAWSADDREHVAETMGIYAELLRQHIRKEDEQIYPMAQAKLSGERWSEIATAFEVFEAEETGEGEHERLHALAHGLIESGRGIRA